MEARETSSHRSEANKTEHLSTFDCLSTHAAISCGTGFRDRFHMYHCQEPSVKENNPSKAIILDDVGSK